MDNRAYWWSGPICGLGNRLIALAAVKACTGERVIHFPWSVDPSCPGGYDDILQSMPTLQPRPEPLPNSILLETHGWEPLTIHQQLSEALGLNLSQAEFCKRFVTELRNLPFHVELKNFAKDWRENAGDAPLVGVHIRRTDRTEHHRDQFRAFLMRKQGMNQELPLFLNALYGLCPASIAHAYEDIAVVSALRKYGQKFPDFRYAVLSDTEAAEKKLERVAARRDVTKDKHFQKPAHAKSAKISSDETIRQTTIREAVADLLCLAQCDAIAQSNRASTFSLVAALIGNKPIITARSRYPFWMAIEESKAQ